MAWSVVTDLAARRCMAATASVAATAMAADQTLCPAKKSAQAGAPLGERLACLGAWRLPRGISAPGEDEMTRHHITLDGHSLQRLFGGYEQVARVREGVMNQALEAQALHSLRAASRGPTLPSLSRVTSASAGPSLREAARGAAQPGRAGSPTALSAERDRSASRWRTSSQGAVVAVATREYNDPPAAPSARDAPAGNRVCYAQIQLLASGASCLRTRRGPCVGYMLRMPRREMSEQSATRAGNEEQTHWLRRVKGS
jgi:hypothetical protein